MRYQNLDMAHPRYGFQAPRKAWAINVLREAICICFSDAGKKANINAECSKHRTEPNRNRPGTAGTETEQEPNRAYTKY